MTLWWLCFLFISIHTFASVLCVPDPQCEDAVCAKQLECRYPKVTVELPDPYNKCCNVTECICEGTRHRLSSSHSVDTQYSKAQRYTNCTMIDGNLEIVFIHPNEEVLEATKHIRVVKGYVLIALSYIHYIDLSSLRLIRGEELYHASRTRTQTCQRIEETDKRGYALYITTNYQEGRPNMGLRGIRMQSLTEIMRGDVKVHDNRDLCFINTIVWEQEIFNTDDQKANVTMSRNATTHCPACPGDCDNGIDGGLHCWGDEPGQCQQFTRLPCRNTCNHRCNSEKQCCDSYCAAGCTVGDIDKGIRRECHSCKQLNNFGECVPQCPSRASGTSEDPIIDESKVRYELTWYCVPECPSTRRIFENEKCVLICPNRYYDVDGACKKCPPAGCTNICRGLQVPGPLLYDNYINSVNIGNFTKNCTIIEGSLSFRQSTFDGDSHCQIPPIRDRYALDVFENVEEITGYLGIEDWPYEDLCIFKNLKRIRGNQVRSMTYSLMVVTDEKDLRELCFNSLEEIQTGKVLMEYNRGLCHVNSINWSLLYEDRNMTAKLRKNAKEKNCAPCHPSCDVRDGCWGPGSDQCLTCRNFTDYTDRNGKFVQKWVMDPKTKLPVPGHNTTNCVTECDFSKGVYATEDGKCFPCDEQCNLTCTGPGPAKCIHTADSPVAHGCKNVFHNGTCVMDCPITRYRNSSNVCLPCGAGCIDGGCDGPEDNYGQNGCKFCHSSYDPEQNEYLYRGAQCLLCIDKLKDEECALGCIHSNTTGVYSCYAAPSSAYIVAIVVVSVIVAFTSVIVIILWKCRKTIRTMRKHIGDKIVGDAAQPDDFDAPVTPSGTAPNRAQLRIVKENELALGKTLGSGAFGAVFKAVWTSMHIEGQTIKIPVAVKKLKTFSHSNEIMDEAYVMASVDNPYLIRLLGICMTEQVSLITQLMPLGSLLEYVRDNSDNIGSRHMLTWCIQIAKGMQYLEDKHLVHRDLAARNVLVKTPHHVKITDFGLAKMLNADESVYFAEGGKLPIKWLAIECITERKFSHLSDVWAFGVTCWEIFTFGARPYEGVRAVEVLALLERGERLVQPPICTIDVYMILIKCWMVDPLSRPKFQELVGEFSKMFHDHTRYIVIKGDPNPGMLSPNPEDERRFFERLIQEDEGNVDGDLMVDDPDDYLLPRIGDENPEYENQSAIEQQQGVPSINGASSSHAANGAAPRNGRLFSRNTPSAHPVTPNGSYNREVNPRQSERSGPPRVSDSSNPDDVFAMSGHGLRDVPGPSKSMTVELPEMSEKGEGAAVRYRPNQGNCPWSTAVRKDSEENPRYTEDPTSHRSSYLEPVSPSAQGQDQLLYDEEQYLLPTPNTARPDYFDPSKPAVAKEPAQETLPKVHQGGPGLYPGSLTNNTYMESGEVSPLLQSTGMSPGLKKMKNRPSASPAAPEYVNTQQQGPEYLNCGPEEEAMRNAHAAQNRASPMKNRVSRSSSGVKGHDVTDGTFYNNEEYMTTDSGIGEDNHSVLSASNGTQNTHAGAKHSGSRNRQNSSLSSGGSSNGSLGPLISGSPLHRARLSSDEQQMDLELSGVRYKPVPKPRQSIKKNQKSTSSNVSIGLDNPEYMMLQESTSVGGDSQPLLPDNSANI